MQKMVVKVLTYEAYVAVRNNLAGGLDLRTLKYQFYSDQSLALEDEIR